MFDFFYGTKTVITNEFLEKNGIPLINKNDIAIDKSSFLATTGSGKFYRGKYKNENISIKIIDISKEYEMITEFFYWKEYKNKDCFLNFIGAYTQGKEGFLVFEYFTCTLEQALNGRLIKEEIKLGIVQSIYRILDYLQKGKKIHRDFRPGNIGLTEKKEIKLLDFVNENLSNIEYVDKYRAKYSPPESLGNAGMMDIKNDIWSYGCILIDIYSKENPIFKINITMKEILESKKFPLIPKDITGLMKDIISRCLDPNYETRINITELDTLMNVFLDNSNKSNNIELKKRIKNNKELSELNEYIDKLDENIVSVNKSITEVYQENTLLMKKSMITINEDINTKINENYSVIKTQLQEIVHKKFEFLNLFYDKILENTMSMQQNYGECMTDNVEAINMINEMKSSIYSLSHLDNPGLFKNLYQSLQNNRENLMAIVKKYSTQSDYDKIINKYDENTKLFEEFKNFCNVEELYLNDIKIFLKKHNEEYMKKARIKDLTQMLNLNVDVDVCLKKYGVIFAKVQENSNLVIIFDYDEKKFNHIKLDDIYFNAKCSTLYHDQKIYYSGGLTSSDQSSSDLNYLKISVKFNEYHFDKILLPNLLNPHFSHSMIAFKNYIFIIGGQNTKECEVFEINKELVKPFPALPTKCLNPALTVINDEFLFCFSGSRSYDSMEGIFRVPLVNIDKLCFSGENIYQNVLYWDVIDYVFDNECSRLKRGMIAFNDRDSIILLGGFDTDKFYNTIYQVQFDLKINQTKLDGEGVIINNVTKDKEKDKSKENVKKPTLNVANCNTLYIYETEHTLPNFTFFNTNFFTIEDRYVFIDGFNNGLEINPTKKFEINYYT